MTLTLTRALEIDIKLIPVEEDNALQLARELWAFDGRPIEPQALRKSLERIPNPCQREGIRYPAILLRRNKELSAAPERPIPSSHCSRSRQASSSARTATASVTP